MPELSFDLECGNCPERDAVQCVDGVLKVLGEKHGDRIGNPRLVWKGNRAEFGLDLLVPFLGAYPVSGTIVVSPPVISIRGSYKKPWFVPEGKVASDFNEIVPGTWKNHCPGRKCPKARAQ